MINAPFLAEWALRSSILIGLATLLPVLARVKAPSMRLAACIAAVCGSLAMPLCSTVFPKWPVFVMPAVESSVDPAVPALMPEPAAKSRFSQQPAEEHANSNWGAAAVAAYGLIAGGLLLRLAVGILGARRLRRSSRATGLESGGIEVRESGHVASPLTVGVVRPVIVLPLDWREWSREKLDAVLAHESSHATRRDPAVQFLSALHRAILWHSPLSWVLHSRIVRLAEDASDDAAMAAAPDRASYAEIVLEFMQRGLGVNWHGINWHGAAMARYGSPDDRIDRILNGAMSSGGLTWKAAAALLALAVPLSYLTAAVIPARAVRGNAGVVAMNRLAVNQSAAKPAGQEPAAASSKSERSESRTIRRYMIVLGDTQSGSWDSREGVDGEDLRAKFGRRFAWFVSGGAGRVITDESVLREMEQAMEPQRKVNVEQDRVNKLQSVVNGLQDTVNYQQNGVNSEQDKVNTLQNRVNAAQQQLNKRQDILNRIQSAGSRENNEAAIRELEKLLAALRAAPNSATPDEVNRLQSQVNDAQGRVNELQGKLNQQQGGVNEEQQKVNREQHLVNEQQHKVSSEFNRRIQEIFDSAIRRGLAKPVN